MSQTIEELDKGILQIFVLKETLYDDEIDFNKYYLENFYASDINSDIIFMVVNLKSRASAREFTEINGQTISMDFTVVRTFEINIKEYNKYLRRKKISNIISSF